MDDQWILVDTSILIDYFRKQNKTESLFFKLSTQFSIATSAVCFFEIFAGAKDKDLAFLHELFKSMRILPFNTDCALIAGNVYQRLRKMNNVVDFRDSFISSTALLNDLILATLNKKHFERIPDLRFYAI